ncbi:Endo-1,4-beta-xylanase 2 [Coniosporium tulheliwenetii]|uniref:Endo-1,4-beta-xylanase 2 n=1 Tax=Coniosporium tulheliwenetii TaxID=3383036 RepID=A0ACC2ZGU9_9PEZI|nr:Endo-1,4-beta-xylanase 2 [Cladosporium sp. JES 115]
MFSTESAQNHDQKLNGEKPAWSTQDVPNHAFVLLETRKFGFEERPMPTLQSPRDVLIRVIATGLCGSDIHYWHHGRIGKYVVENPIILGHESAGIVEACGPDVKSLAVGDRVALEPGVGCNTCEACRSGRYNLCGSMRFAATPPYDGTLATYYVLPEECCFVLPSHISFQEGALVEPLAVAVHCCRLAGDMQGKSAIVFGAGPIGLLACAVARASGAATVVAVDIVQSRLDFATRFGATATYLMSSQLPEVNADIMLAQTRLSEGADVIVEATGAEPCINCGIHALKRGGIFVQAGLGTPVVSFPVAQICDKEATFKGSFRYGPGDYKLAVELLQSGRISVKELVTHEFSFAEAEQAFINVLERRGIKSIIYGPSVDQTLVNETAML